MMKRSGLPRRSGPIPRQSAKRKTLVNGVQYSTITAPKKPIQAVNVERRAKRKKRQASKHAAYMRSETRKVVDARANGQCEAWLGLEDGWVTGVYADEGDNRFRCLSSEFDRNRLQHHHLTYARYGGDELPEDILKCCKRCHDALEAEHPTRNRR